MYYSTVYHKSYEEVTLACISSNKELALFYWITNRFTHQRVEAAIVYSECKLDVSQAMFAKLVKKLIDLGYLKNETFKS